MSTFRWYYNESSHVKMNKTEMIEGNACAALYKNKWMRAEFIERPVDDKVKVCFVDFGTIDVINVSQCRYLKHIFSSIPKICYPGALEFIQPIKNQEIEQKLVQSFCKMVQDKPLVGFVINVDYEVGSSFENEKDLSLT